MGCAQSRIENEESVSRCKERRNLMKEAVMARNAFAAGHSGYAIALKNTGSALSDYGHGETEEIPQLHPEQHPLDHPSQPPPPPPPIDNLPPPPPPIDNLPPPPPPIDNLPPPPPPIDNLPPPPPPIDNLPPPPPPIDNLPPPPPPLPNFSPSPIKQAATMPLITMESIKSGREIESHAISEEDEDDHEVGGDENGKGLHGSRNGVGEMGHGVASSSTSTPRTPEMKAVRDSKGMAWDYFFMVDENMSSMGGDDDNDGEHDENGDMGFDKDRDLGGGFGDGVNGVEPKTPENVKEGKVVEGEGREVKKVKPIEHSNTAHAEFRRVRKLMDVPTVSLMQILTKLDDHFLKASGSAQEISKVLEATRLHYHSNFADNRGHIDHSARVMRVITWNRSFKGMHNGGGGRDEFDSEEYETLATVLDKLLAWEKKLYEEVKQGELMKIEYKRKVALLNKQKKRGASAESLEKTKASVSHLHTNYIVDMQSMDSTVSEVNRLRDEQLYPKLVSLAEGMTKMWESMCEHHDSQQDIVKDLKSLDITQAPKETTKHHHERTDQLMKVIQEWQSQFEKLVTHQKQYIQALNSWLRLNLVPIESSLKEKISSPPRVQHPPIQTLVKAWHDSLEKLPDEVAKSAISSFASTIGAIKLHQEEEMKLKEKCEETRKEYMRKNQAFEEWYQKYLERRGPDETEPERGEVENSKDPISEKQFIVESLKKRLEEEVETYQRHCVQVREKSLGSLKTRLPELFRAMLDYANACYVAYDKLKSTTKSQKLNGGPNV